MFPEGGLHVWTWKMDVVSVSPYFQMIIMLELIGSVLILLSCIAVTTLMLGLVIEMKITINTFNEGINLGIMECSQQENKDKKCLEFIGKCVDCHVGIIR